MESKGKCPYPNQCPHEKDGQCYNPSVMGFCPPELESIRDDYQPDTYGNEEYERRIMEEA